jgi:hypothetical protein
MLAPLPSIRVPKRFSAALLLMALGPIVAAPAQDGESVKYRHIFEHDFRGKPLPAELTLFGHEVETYAKSEPQGLRITLPKNREKLLPVGVKTTYAVRADFEIIFTVEILKAETPDKGSFGVGAMVYVNKTDDKTEGATLGRVLRPGGKEMIVWDRWPGKKAKFEGGDTDCTEKIVRLRLKRTGPKWFYQWASGTDGQEFNSLDDPNPDFGADELGQVVLRCSSGGQHRAVDVRFIALRIRSDGVSQAANAAEKTPADKPAPPVTEATGKTPSRGWLVAGGLIGAALIVMFALVIAAWFVLRQRRAAEKTPEPAKDKKAKK